MPGWEPPSPKVQATACAPVSPASVQVPENETAEPSEAARSGPATASGAVLDAVTVTGCVTAAVAPESSVTVRVTW